MVSRDHASYVAGRNWRQLWSSPLAPCRWQTNCPLVSAPHMALTIELAWELAKKTGEPL